MKKGTTLLRFRSSPVATRKRGLWTKSPDVFAKRSNCASKCRVNQSKASSSSASSASPSRHEDGRSTVVPIHSGETIGPGLLHRILRDCQFSVEDLQKLL